MINDAWLKNHLGFANLLCNLNLEPQLTANEAIRSFYARSNFNLRETIGA